MRDNVEIIMTTRGKLVSWVKPFVPGLVDRIARRVIERGY